MTRIRKVPTTARHLFSSSRSVHRPRDISTAAEKLVAYQQIPDVQEYVVEQDKMHVEVHRRQSDGRWITYFTMTMIWMSNRFYLRRSEQLDEIYDRVKFPAPGTERFGEMDARD